jgi:hypothetical protein
LVLHDLADETELGILSFADSVQIHTEGQNGPMVRLGSPGSREQVASAIPVFISMPSNGGSATGSVQESCLTCALAEAIAVNKNIFGSHFNFVLQINFNSIFLSY